jgi:ubiquinone/menaquinone biosynthesis C-methylase UbiE
MFTGRAASSSLSEHSSKEDGVAQLEFDKEASKEIEAVYLIEDAVRRRRIVREALAVSPGERLLDVGCGPGFYCLELSEEVGPSGQIVGVDPSPAMLELARRRCAGRENVELRQGDAVSVPADDGDFDAALSVQVLEYVADVEAALAELHRALRPGGRVLVWDIDWATLSVHSEDEDRNERVLAAWDEHLTDPSLPRTLAPRLRAVGFEDVRMRAHTIASNEVDSGSYGAALVPFIGTFVAGRNGLTEADGQAWVEEQRELGERGEFFFAATQFCFTGRKPEFI